MASGYNTDTLHSQLTEEQMREALSRAEELQLQAALSDESSPAFESVLSAAEEMGIPRETMRRALEEKLGKPMETPAVGDMVFARSADNKFYLANVLSAEPGRVRVQFLSGGEATLAEEALRPCNFMPGMKVVVQWPLWGWYKADVVSYDAKKKKVLVTDGWHEKKFPISEIRLEPEKKPRSNQRAKLYWGLVGLGVALGGPLGALVTWLLMR